MHYRYFDWAATAPPLAEAREAVHRCAEAHYANPSSRHLLGQEAASVLDDARSRIASFLQTDKHRIIFTSGGTESNFMVLSSLFWKKRKGQVILSSAEHASVYAFLPFLREIGCTAALLPSPMGYISPHDLSKALTRDTSLVALNAVHNVSGVLQDLPSLVSTVRDFEKRTGTPRIHIHVDAVQALGKVPFSLDSLDIDSASMSAHKCSGPRGIGALYTRIPLTPVSPGGGQESGMRGGTENLPGIAGFAAALDYFASHQEMHLTNLEETGRYLREACSSIPGVTMLQDPQHCFVPSIMLLSVSPIPSEVMIRVLGDRGFLVSAGSACSSKNAKKLERVLDALGIGADAAAGVLRISFGHSTTTEDVQLLTEALDQEVRRLGGMLS